MHNIEVELRSIVTEEKYKELIEYFNNKGIFQEEINQVTYYYDGEQDLRIQQSNNYSKIWLKKGKIHDDVREEIEIKCNRDDFTLLHQLFINLGYKKEIEWRRIRKRYLWDEIKVTLDFTIGYGYIIEMEILTNNENKKRALKMLNDKFKELSIHITPRDTFNAKFYYYKENWKKLIKENRGRI